MSVQAWGKRQTRITNTLIISSLNSHFQWTSTQTTSLYFQTFTKTQTTHPSELHLLDLVFSKVTDSTAQFQNPCGLLILLSSLFPPVSTSLLWLLNIYFKKPLRLVSALSETQRWHQQVWAHFAEMTGSKTRK